MSFVLALTLVAGVLAAFLFMRRVARERLVRRLRATWGAPVVRKRNMSNIVEWHRSCRDCLSDTEGLDDRTWEDLNLDDVFAHVDRTESTLGRCALYHRLRTTPVALDLSAFDAAASRMEHDSATRERAQMALSRLQDVNGYNLWPLAHTDALTIPRWYAVFPLLTVMLLVAATVVALKGTAFLPLFFAAVAVNTIVGLVASNRIISTAPLFRQIAPLVVTAQRLMFLEGNDLESVSGVIRTEAPRFRVLKGLSQIVSGNLLMVTVDSPIFLVVFNDLLLVVYQYLTLTLLLDWNATLFGARLLKAQTPGLLRLIAAMGNLDAAISIASFRAGSGVWTRPRFCDTGQPAVLSDVRHPLVAQAVANSIQLAPPHGVLVTGSNMSGKSTFLRTVGLAAVMAQTVYTCTASAYVAPPFRVHSCIGRSDDLLAGKSYYAVEVETLLGLVAASENSTPHLFLLDELFRGTNAVERIAAGEAVLKELVLHDGSFKSHVVLAATHDGELVAFLRGVYAPVHFGDTVNEGNLTFDYRLTPGATTSRNAITLLKRQGAPESLVESALRRAILLDQARHSQT